MTFPHTVLFQDMNDFDNYLSTKPFYTSNMQYTISDERHANSKYEKIKLTYHTSSANEDYFQNCNTGAVQSPCASDNDAFYQTYSPSPSKTILESPLDFYYGEIGYFPTASSENNYSLSTSLPSLSPQTQNLSPYHNDSASFHEEYFNINYTTLQHPLIENECCISPYNFDSNDTISVISCKSQTDLLPSNVPVAPSTVGDKHAKKTFSCPHCDRTFTRKYDVIRHQRIHTGSKPYKCPCCMKGFSRSDARIRHFRTETSCRDGADKLALLNSSSNNNNNNKDRRF